MGSQYASFGGGNRDAIPRMFEAASKGFRFDFKFGIWFGLLTLMPLTAHSMAIDDRGLFSHGSAQMQEKEENLGSTEESAL